MKEITLIVPNKVGVLASITGELGNNGINLAGISAQGFGDSGVIRLITSDVKSAVSVLTKYIGGIKRNSYELRVADVIIVRVPDRPGEFAKIAKKIAKARVNIEGVYSLGVTNRKADIIIKPENFDKAVTALKKEGIKIRI